MKTNAICIFLFFLTCGCPGIFAQTVKFTYDEAGNRTSGKTISMVRSDIREEEEESPTAISAILAEHTIRIYPNPTKGLLKIELENLSRDEKAAIRLYDMSGKQVMAKEGIASSTELDITSQADGIYLLKIFIGEYQTEWKVIKQ
ncbi:MAG: T9SS type A sorting domain-containing protein [Bacteroidales bacterium]|nr:T9SS type A sorting domain-containing protein [Bacteroidales bacterium]